jgi:nitrile hydratase beta subunit-like protein
VRSHHDMGGLPAGKVDRSEHDYADWERRVDAMAVLLGRKRRLTVDERRRAIETLTPQAYDALSYYERWVVALGQTMVQRGIITSAELAKKMLEVEDRGQG